MVDRKILVEIEFDSRVSRFAENYRPHFAVEDHELLGVQVDGLSKESAHKKIFAEAHLLYEIDYSRLINFAAFSIKEGAKTVGHGRVLAINGETFSDEPEFAAYLRYKALGLRKPAIDSLQRHINCLNENKMNAGIFFEKLCRVLDILHYQQGEWQTVVSGHWFNERLKHELYDYLLPLTKKADAKYEHLKWFCLYARCREIDKNNNLDICRELLEQDGIEDKALFLYYLRCWESRLYYAIHELPIGYLGDDPLEDLAIIKRIRELAKKYVDDTQSVLKSAENAILEYLNVTR